MAQALVRPELVVFPVRHHSPACSWHLSLLFDLVRPSAVLVEGPRSFNRIIPLLTSPAAKMPLACYTYAVRRQGEDGSELRRAAYYPFCDYSPELVALRQAQVRGVPSAFIDLDFAAQCRFHADPDDLPESLLDERYYQRSGYLRTLASRCGCRDQEELWEHLFETSLSPDPLRHIERVAAWCHFARLDTKEEEMAADGTLAREAEMAWHIRQALAERKPEKGPVLAVMGGFHAVAMPPLLATPVPRPENVPATHTDSACALIRYSFDRLDRLNGYAAGMTSPAWHQALWEGGLTRHDGSRPPSAKVRRDVALAMLLDIAVELRQRHRVDIPVPAISAAYQQLLLLAELRRRPAPLRDDVLDAVTSCFIKGDADADGFLVRATALRVFSGRSIGEIPPGSDTPPLVRDFARRARRQKLRIDDTAPRRVNLDIYRKPQHRVTSRLLHGLVFLEIPFGFLTAGPDFVNGSGLERMLEHWEYAYSPATEGALVEASVYGETIPSAVAARFAKHLDQADADRDAAAVARLMLKTCALGLHDHLPKVLALLREAIAGDASFASVAGAAGSMGLLWESREPLEAQDVPELPLLLRAAYERAVFLGAELCGGSAGGSEVVQALMQLRELLVSGAGRDLDAELYWNMLQVVAGNRAEPQVCGAATGLLYCAARLSAEQLGAMLAGFLDGMAAPRDSAAFLRGVLGTAREVAWQQPILLEMLDRQIRVLDEQAFVALLPDLRLAFSEMTPSETDRVAAAVAELHGEEALDDLVRYDLSEQEIQAHLVLSDKVREILAGDGLAGWLVS